MLILTLVLATGAWSVNIDTRGDIIVAHDGTPEVRVSPGATGSHPHSAYLVDVDGDDALDVIAYEGESATAQTLVYLRRANVLTLVFRDAHSHASVLESDGKPQLVLGLGGADNGCPFDKTGHSKALAYLQKHTLIADQTVTFVRHMREPIVIYAWREGTLREAAPKEFLSWRSAVLREQVKTADMGCASLFAELAAKTDTLAKRK